MKSLDAFLKKSEGFKSVADSIKLGGYPVLLSELCAAQKAHITAYFAGKIGKCCIVLTPDEATAAKAVEDISFFTQSVAFLPYKDISFYNAESASRDIQTQRLQVLGQMAENKLQIAVMTPDTAMQTVMPREVYSAASFEIKVGDRWNINDLMKKMVNAGYVKTDKVEAAGQFARRGSITDIFVANEENPVRIEFWDDEIDTVSYFDIETQRRSENIDSFKITPAKELIFDTDLSKKISEYAEKLPDGNPLKKKMESDADKLTATGALPWAQKYIGLIYGEATPIEYCDGAIFAYDYGKTKERAEKFEERFTEDISQLAENGYALLDKRYIVSWTELLSEIPKRGILLDTFTKTSYDFPLKATVKLNGIEHSLWKGSFEELKELLDPVKFQNYIAVILAGTSRAATSLARDLVSEGFTAVGGELPDKLEHRTVYVTSGKLSSGFAYPKQKFLLISQGRPDEALKKRKKRVKEGQRITALTDINIGDAVVHSVHGIGIYGGVKKIETMGIVKDYLTVKYAGTDVLYVPVTQLDMVTKYIGQEAGSVKLSKMGGTDWVKSKARVKKAVKDMAKELIELYSKRMSKKGYAFTRDGEWQRDFEEHFEYTETDDQLTASEDIKRDMESVVPMERLLCGDVGFGKTEVALRAAFKCIADGKQCAILVPTTLLAWQHYQTLVRRMEGFPVNMALLCRFRTKGQQEEAIRKLARGEIDIVVGTHRLIQKDIRFRDLGLIIIDEEQRFGVLQKEYLKQKFDTVDCLSLSATPIPRTLNMALSGIRDMSCIEEAPGGRQPIQSYVLEYDEGVIAEVIERELRRGGQVYYLHNFTETIDRVAARLMESLPDARIAVAHGKMNEQMLSDVWEKLVNHEIDVLVCTTIIETGVDVPNANTLIIEDADRMGLSQLHQLRGRIGRSYRSAFAYFTFRRGKNVTEIARKRLEAIREFTEFGSGFKIALRDLEIRGAGNVLGGEQHGHMDSVGYDMYLKLLSEAIDEERGTVKEEKTECAVDIPVTAHIPENYVPQRLRIDIYRRIADIRSSEDASDVLDELIDRFGEPPMAVRNLITVSELRNFASELNFTEIGDRAGVLMFYPKNKDGDLDRMLTVKFGRQLTVIGGERPHYAFKYKGGALLSAKEFLTAVKEINAQIEEYRNNTDFS